MTFTPGTVSHGTLREEDLVPAFLDTLENLAPTKAENIRILHADAIAHLQDGVQPEDDRIQWLMEALHDALSHAAPEGYVWGAHEGDGSDFGFWEWEDPESAVTCDDCPAVSEAGWGDTPLCLDCQTNADPSKVCKTHQRTFEDECPLDHDPQEVIEPEPAEGKGAFYTLTFVVKSEAQIDVDSDDAPHIYALLRNDEVMFYALQHGVTDHALTLGADPTSWP